MKRPGSHIEEKFKEGHTKDHAIIWGQCRRRVVSRNWIAVEGREGEGGQIQEILNSQNQ
jgi:hypothetical protein